MKLAVYLLAVNLVVGMIHLSSWMFDIDPIKMAVWVILGIAIDVSIMLNRKEKD